MKKQKTESENIFILSNSNSSIVRKYYKKEPEWYMLNVPPKVIFKTIEHCNIKHPMLLKKVFNHIDLEYIQGRKIDDNFDKMALIGLISNCIYEFKKINCSKFIKYIKWTCNTEFLHEQTKYMINTISKLKCYDKLKVLGLGVEAFESYLSTTLDDQRNISFIHGNLNRNNFINNNGNFYLLDWENATYGDLAYEIAIHLANENYSKDEMGVLIERVCTSNGINQTNLINDITTYITFEYRRRCIAGIYNCIELYKKGENYNFELEKIINIYSKIPGNIPKNDVKAVIEC